MKTRKRRLSDLLTVIGIALVVISVSAVMISFLSQKSTVQKASAIAAELRSLVPDVQNGFPDGRLNTAMPTAEIGGVNFVGVIEIPAYGTSLPIRADWKPLRVSSYPCRLSGNTWSGDLIIGGSDAEGQFDFMKIITNGDRIYVTDPAGIRFTYRVTNVIRTDSPTVENLLTEEDDLVIFVKNTYSFGYTAARCKSE